jgi:small subunit ribosomal protein S13e
MGRMHSGGKGISKSSLPYKRAPASWVKTTPEQVEEQVNKLAKRGLTPSQVRCSFSCAFYWICF